MNAAETAEIVRAACLEAAAAAYEDAGMQGLCSEGRWEAALGAIQRLDVGELLRERLADPSPAPATPPRE
jgi:hypothetical protein